jgi:Holliday junction DNA helicase RuvA
VGDYFEHSWKIIMIGRLSGILVAKNPPQILLDVGGIGYEIDVPMSTFYNLPVAGEPVSLQTHMIVREDGHFLYGFLTEDERAAFRQLLKISGVGARTALAVLSGLSVCELAQAVTLQETGRLVKIPGIGKKTAERLLLELKDRLPKTSFGATHVGHVEPVPADDILNALIALGYNEREALPVLRTLPEGVAVSEGIRQALKQLSKV